MQKMISVLVIVVTVFGFTPLAFPQQSEKPARIGYLTAGSAKAYKPRLAALRAGLRELGYRDGRDFIIEARFAAGRRERLPTLASELVALDVDLIVTNGGSATKTADRTVRQSGKQIPVVFALAPDPVGVGLVASLAQPGGNITGPSNSNNVLVTKRLDLLKETLPKAQRVAVLWSRRARSGGSQLEMLKRVAPTLGVTLIPVTFEHPKEFERALQNVRAARPDALNVLGWSLANSFRKKIAARALESGCQQCSTGTAMLSREV